jgi:hypothetical protein
MGTKSRESIYGASVRHRRSVQPRHARKPIGWPAALGTSACSAFRDRPNPPRPSATPPTLATAILRSSASTATRIKRSRLISSAGQRRRQFMNWSATCAVRIAQRSGATPTSAVGAVVKEAIAHGWITCIRPAVIYSSRKPGRTCSRRRNPKRNAWPGFGVFISEKSLGACHVPVAYRRL